MKAGEWRSKRRCKAFPDMEQLCRSIRPRSEAVRLTQLGGIQTDEQIGQIENQQLFDIYLFLRSSSFRLVLSVTAFFTRALNFSSLPRTDSRRSAFFTLTAVNF